MHRVSRSRPGSEGGARDRGRLGPRRRRWAAPVTDGGFQARRGAGGARAASEAKGPASRADQPRGAGGGQGGRVQVLRDSSLGAGVRRGRPPSRPGARAPGTPGRALTGRARCCAPGRSGLRRGRTRSGPGSGSAASCSEDSRRPPTPPPPASDYVAHRKAPREAGGCWRGRDFRLCSLGRKCRAARRHGDASLALRGCQVRPDAETSKRPPRTALGPDSRSSSRRSAASCSSPTPLRQRPSVTTDRPEGSAGAWGPGDRRPSLTSTQKMRLRASRN